MRIIYFFSFFLIWCSHHYAQQFKLQGSAIQTGTGTYTLTPAAMNQAGMITNLYPKDLTQDFTLNFQLNFGSQDAGADGITFLLSNVCNPPLNSGGLLGVPAINKSIIVEFDTYDNGGIYDDGHSFGFQDHLCIYKDGNFSPSNRIIDGGNPVCFNFSGSCSNIEGGNWYTVEMSWDYVNATSQVLQVKVNGVLLASATGNHIANIFNNDPQVFWSITSATGALTNLHQFKTDTNNDFTYACGSSFTLAAPTLGSNYSWTNNSSTTHTATYTATNNTTITCTYTDSCGQNQSVTFIITVPAGTPPTFSLPTTLCKGEEAFTLPTTSNNGISGTWSPSTVSNQTDGSYVFTPSSGGCSSTFTLNVDVTDVSFGAFAAGVDIFNTNFNATLAQVYDIIGTFNGQNYVGFNGQTYINQNFGTHTKDASTLFIKGAEVRTWKNSGTNVCEGKLFYTVYPTGNRPTNPTFSSITLNNATDCPCNGCAFPGGGNCNLGDQKWREFNQSISLTNRCPGTYILEVYYEFTGSCSGTSSCDVLRYISDASSNNFKATFTIASTPLTGTASANSTSLCEGNTLNLSASGSGGTPTYSYSWTGPNGFTSTQQNPSIITTTSSHSGTYTVRITDGCGNFIDKIVEIIVNALPTTPTLSSNSPICSGSDAVFTITGTPNLQITYNINGGVNQTTTIGVGGTSTVTVTGATANQILTITGITNGICSLTGLTLNETVTVNSTPTAPVLSANSPICSGSDAIFTLTGTPNLQITYNINGGGNQVVAIGVDGTATITVIGATTNQTLTITSIANGFCSLNGLSINATVTIKSLPTATISSISPICEKNNAVFTLTGTPNSEINYIINGGVTESITLNGAGSGTITVPNVTVSQNLIILSVEQGGCSNTTTISNTITIKASPITSLISSN